MRSTRITALGIVIFLFLQAALSSCLRIGGKPKYDIDEDSLFFSRMPPRTETGANIVAFELDGKPYVFPKEGMCQSIFQAPPWVCDMEKTKINGIVESEIFWMSWRKGKKYNNSYSAMCIHLSEENVDQALFVAKGYVILGEWSSEDNEISFEVTKHVPLEGLICGRFSGVLKHEREDTYQRIENGFFDLKYTITEIY